MQNNANMIDVEIVMKIRLPIVFILSFCIAVSAQNKTEAEKLAEFAFNINTFNRLYPQEKVYLHFDNTGYYLGETIWFKAYITVAEDNRLSELSKVLYVELLTPEGNIVETQKLKIENGQARGGFALKNRYFTGYYQVRAYTRCMLNFGDNVIFSRVFPVYSQVDQAGNGIYVGKGLKEINIKPRNIRKEEKEKPKDVSLVFFPEGGNMVTGVANRVAFKATDKDGKAFDATGRIYNSSNEIVTTFTSVHLGMGSFILYPDGNKLVAKISYNGKDYSFDLPESKPAGYTMRIDNLHPETISVEIDKTANLPAQTLGVTLACRGKVYEFKTFEPDSTGQYILRLLKKDLPSGVIQITLFTPQGEILAQRQAFVNNNIHALPVKTNIQSTFEPRSPISIEMEVKDDNNQPVEATFSLSVRDDSTEIKTDYTDNILYNLLLSSDLKGYIENPAYYFEADDNQHCFALDLLMLVQGWTRYSWKQAAGVEPFKVKHWIEKSLMIEGSVLAYSKPVPQEDIEMTIWMTSQDGLSQQGKCITDKNGNFNFEFADLSGTFEFNLSAKKKDKNGKYSPLLSRITLDRNFSPAPMAIDYNETHPVETAKNEKTELSIPNKPAEADVQTVEMDSIERLSNKNQGKGVKSYVLPEVEVKGKMSSRRAMLENPNFTVYDIAREMDKYLDKGESEPDNVFDFLASTDRYYSYSLLNPKFYKDEGIGEDEGGTGMKFYSFYNKGKAAFFIPDFQEPLGNSLAAWQRRHLSVAQLGMDEIEYIAITNVPEGDPVCINIILNETGISRHSLKGSRKTYFDGFASPVEFYSPDYSFASLSEPDVRRTLYWNPDVRTDSLGRASVYFYNNDACKKISISAEGLTDGNVFKTVETGRAPSLQ